MSANMSIHRIADNGAKVKDALHIWAEWIKNDRLEQTLGYGKCTGFNNGGSTSSWNDFERAVDKNMAINVQAIHDGLKLPQRLAIDHFHLSAAWKPQRYSLEESYSEALLAIEIALRRRNLL